MQIGQPAPLRLVIIHNQALVCDSLAVVLQAESTIVVIGAGGCDVVDTLLIEGEPTVILLDNNIPDANGTSALRVIQRYWPDAAVILLATEWTANAVRAAIASQVHGCISLAMPLPELVNVIHLVAEGCYVFDAAAHAALAEAFSTDTNNDTCSSLTTREQQVAQYASQGMSNKRIADELGVTIKTVESHLRSAFRKTGCNSRFLLGDVAKE